MERHRSDGFARSVSLYMPIVIIINNVLGHNSRSSRKHDWEDLTTTHMVSHMATHGIARDGSKMVNSEVKAETGFNFGGIQTLTGLWNLRKVFPVEEFKGAFMEWVICDNITLRQSVSQRLRKMVDLVDKAAKLREWFYLSHIILLVAPRSFSASYLGKTGNQAAKPENRD